MIRRPPRSTLSLHDALPISRTVKQYEKGLITRLGKYHGMAPSGLTFIVPFVEDRKSTRLNSSHGYISYAVFCLKKKKHKRTELRRQRIFRGELLACACTI